MTALSNDSGKNKGINVTQENFHFSYIIDAHKVIRQTKKLCDEFLKNISHQC